MPEFFEGGCLCGAVRYRVSELGRVGFCHCRMCQKASGAPVVAWTHAPLGAFAWTKGTPKPYRSSPAAFRFFCPDCGSQLGYLRAEQPVEMELNVATFDHPETLAPAYHIHTASQLPWLHIADDLPRHPGPRVT